jgi:thioredoxin
MTQADVNLERIRQEKAAAYTGGNQSQTPDHVIEIESVDHFNEIVNTYQNNLIIVDFWAPWCGPCRTFAPAFSALQKEFDKKGVIFTKLNVDQLPEISAQFGIQGIPTTMFIKGKKIVHHQVGMAPKPQFAQIIESVLNKINQTKHNSPQ